MRKVISFCLIANHLFVSAHAAAENQYKTSFGFAVSIGDTPSSLNGNWYKSIPIATNLHLAVAGWECWRSPTTIMSTGLHASGISCTNDNWATFTSFRLLCSPNQESSDRGVLILSSGLPDETMVLTGFCITSKTNR